MSSPVSSLRTSLSMCRGNFLDASVLALISVCRSWILANIDSWVRVMLFLLIMVLVAGVSFAGVSAGFEIFAKIVCCTLGCAASSCSAAVRDLFVPWLGVVVCTLGDGRIGIAFICTSLFVRATLAKMVSRRCRASRSSSHMLFGVWVRSVSVIRLAAEIITSAGVVSGFVM